MAKLLKTDICIIGGGSGGLSVAAGAAQMGADVVLVEGDKMGGDCLNSGCVPSKALLAAADLAHSAKRFQTFGLHGNPPRVNFAEVMAHVRDIIAGIAPMDSVERFNGLGVKVIEGSGRFINPRILAVGQLHIRAKRFVIATGSNAYVPPIRGLAQVPFLTNETLWDLTICPDHLLIIGGGPIGIEMAQAFVRLGARVSVLESQKMLAREDPELTAYMLDELKSCGAQLHENVQIEAVNNASAKPNSDIVIDTDKGQFVGSHLLVAAGRKPNVKSLNLAAAGVALTDEPLPAIATNAHLQSSNRKIFALGDVIGGPQFTHAAGYQAGIIIRNILFFMRAKTDYRALPRVTYGAPELAHVGLNEAQARKKFSDIRCLRWPFDENDRARTERDRVGMVKIIVHKNGRILGASIVGRGAGDLLAPWVLAVEKNLSIAVMARLIAPYPTRSEAGKRAAGDYYTPTLFSPRTRKIVKFLSLFRRF